jgi:group I intron endonuclease
MNKKTIGIYQIRNKVISKIYIGSSKNIEGRWYVHKRDLKLKQHHSIYLQRAWEKYGEENFTFEILELLETTDILLEREQYYLDKYESYKKENGYNICSVAENCTGVIASKETRRKMSESHTGQKRSSEQKKNISKSLRGKSKVNRPRITEKEAKEIKILLELTELTQKEIAEIYNTIHQNISNIKLGIQWVDLEIKDLTLPSDLKTKSDEIISKRTNKKVRKIKVVKK